MTKKTKTTCRICLQFGSIVKRTCKSLFEIHNGSTISNNLILIANVKIQEDDGLPNKICEECLKELDAAINFKDKCERSDKILHSESEFEQIKSNTLPIPQTPFLTEVAIKKEDSSEDDIEYEEVNYYDNECDISETEIQPIKVTSSAKPELKCQDCGETFKSNCKLRVHWKRVHLLEKAICNFCKRSFKTLSTFNNHLKKRPRNCILASKTRIEGIGKARIFHCRHCSFISRRPHDFENHLNIHTGDRPYYCEMCAKGFSQQSSLETHNESVHKIIKKEITCQYCGELVKGRRKVHRHMQRHTSSPLQCDICKKMYKNKSTLIEHLKHHSGVKPFQCEKCAASYYTHTSLINHKRVAHRINKLIYKCETCGIKFACSNSLKKHKFKHNIFNVACHECGRFYPNIEELESHQKRHTKEKSICLQCNRIFCDERSLKRHKATTHKHRQNVIRSEAVKLKGNMTSDLECKDEKIKVEIPSIQK